MVYIRRPRQGQKFYTVVYAKVQAKTKIYHALTSLV